MYVCIPYKTEDGAPTAQSDPVGDAEIELFFFHLFLLVGG